MRPKTCVFNFFYQNPFVYFFFCFPQTQNQPYHPRLSPIHLHLLSHSPSLRSEAVTVALHLRSKPSPIPPSPIQNPRLTLHRRSHPHPHPHPHPPSPISPSTLASRSISDLHRHPPRQQQRLLRDPSQALASASRPISGFGFCFETHLALSILLALPKTPSNSVTNCESFSFFFFLKLVWLYGCFFFIFYF